MDAFVLKVGLLLASAGIEFERTPRTRCETLSECILEKTEDMTELEEAQTLETQLQKKAKMKLLRWTAEEDGHLLRGIVFAMDEEVRNKEEAIKKLEECDRLRSEALQTVSHLAEQLSKNQQEKKATMQKYQAENTLLGEQVRDLKLELHYMKLKDMKKQQVESARAAECGLTEASRDLVKQENALELIGRLDTVEALEDHFRRVYEIMKKNGLLPNVQELVADGNVRKRIRVE